MNDIETQGQRTLEGTYLEELRNGPFGDKKTKNRAL